MKTIQISDKLVFNESNPHAEPLNVDAQGRVLLYALRPSQVVKEHNAPNSPVKLFIIKGHGLFAGGDQHESRLGPNTLLILDPGEDHSIRALDEDLVFLAFLHGVPAGQFTPHTEAYQEHVAEVL